MLRVTSRLRSSGLTVLLVALLNAGCGNDANDPLLPDGPSPVRDAGLIEADSSPPPAPAVDGGTAPHPDSALGDDSSTIEDLGANDTSSPAAFRCTQVIGYSQVNQWYVAGAFESYVEDDRWQLLYNGGAGVDMWQDPSYVGWSRALISPCSARSDRPDRVLLSVSGPYGDDEVAWAAAIRATIATIRSKIPSASRIVLQPVVGGPNHQTCLLNGNEVRASWQHAHIDNAIAEVVGDASNIVAGMSPEVGDCAEYADAKGHFTSQGSEAAGKAIGEHYAAEEVAP